MNGQSTPADSTAIAAGASADTFPVFTPNRDFRSLLTHLAKQMDLYERKSLRANHCAAHFQVCAATTLELMAKLGPVEFRRHLSMTPSEAIAGLIEGKVIEHALAGNRAYHYPVLDALMNRLQSTNPA